MSAMEKAKNTAQVVKGRLKESAGRSTGNTKLEAEGRSDKVIGNVKQAGEKLKDAARSARSSAKR